MAVVKDSGFLSLGVFKYIVCLCKGCNGCCVFFLYCDAWSYRCSCMGSMSVSSCRAGLMTDSLVPMSVSFCLPHSVAVSDFIICSGLCACTEML